MQVSRADRRQQSAARRSRLREEDPKQWTQAAVAVALGVDQSTVSKWFSNTTNGNANSNGKPDARLTIPRDAKPEIVKRVLKGEPATQA